MITELFQIIQVLSLCACAYAVCTPEAVKDDLIQCLMNNHMGTYYQFPIVPEANYANLCSNVSCLTYCMSLVAAPCKSQDFMIHIGNANALSTAYLGLCDQLETDVRSTLSCGNTVSNQGALNTISAFQTSLETYYSTSTENTTAICSEWLTMKGELDTLIAGSCSGTGLANWNKFLNTIIYECDDSATPSWYAEYSETTNTRCSGAEKILQKVTFPVLMAVLLFIKKLA